MLAKCVGICLTLMKLILEIMNKKQVVKIVLTGIKYVITLILGALGGSEIAVVQCLTFKFCKYEFYN